MSILKSLFHHGNIKKQIYDFPPCANASWSLLKYKTPECCLKSTGNGTEISISTCLKGYYHQKKPGSAKEPGFE
ncbi:MAG: hypothetical protein ABIT96_13555 [Ferruginibacter sp.]